MFHRKSFMRKKHANPERNFDQIGYCFQIDRLCFRVCQPIRFLVANSALWCGMRRAIIDGRGCGCFCVRFLSVMLMPVALSLLIPSLSTEISIILDSPLEHKQFFRCIFIVVRWVGKMLGRGRQTFKIWACRMIPIRCCRMCGCVTTSIHKVCATLSHRPTLCLWQLYNSKLEYGINNTSAELNFWLWT